MNQSMLCTTYYFPIIHYLCKKWTDDINMLAAVFLILIMLGCTCVVL